MEEISLRLPQGNISGKLWGKKSNQTPILALHGWLDNAGSFDPICEILQNQFLIFAPDLPGHGLSDRKAPGSTYHFIDTVSDAIAITEALEWKTFSLMGHSLGAAISTFIAGTFPERIERAVLFDGIGPFSAMAETLPDRLREHVIKKLALTNKFRPAHNSWETACTHRAKKGGFPIEIAQILARRGVIQSEAGFHWQYDPALLVPSPVRLTEEQVRTVIRNISAPVLLMTAEPGDREIRSFFEPRLQIIKNIRVLPVQGHHHFHMHPEVLPLEEIRRHLGDHSNSLPAN